jgi:hypothetical protein
VTVPFNLAILALDAHDAYGLLLSALDDHGLVFVECPMALAADHKVGIALLLKPGDMLF